MKCRVQRVEGFGNLDGSEGGGSGPKSPTSVVDFLEMILKRTLCV